MNYSVMDIPDGKSGNWEVSTFEVPKKSIENIRIMFQSPGRVVPPGKYKRLSRNGAVIMSNTPAEIRDYMSFVHRARGSVLINGLGLGCVLADVLNKKDVSEVTVVEISEDVISLVAPYFSKDPRLTIINADAYTFKASKGKRFNTVWHDIWDDICTDNLSKMATLHRKYGRRTDFQDSWSRDICLHYRRQDQRYSRW